MATATELSTPPRRPLTVIEPAKGWRLHAVRELWSYRELLFYLTWRDVKIRYKQTLLGGAWAVLQPLMLMLVFSIFLGHLAGISSRVDIPYPLFAFAGLVPWTLFAQSLINSSDSLVRGTDLVSKVYFPRLILPIAAAGSFVFDFVIAFGLLIAMMVYYGIAPTGAVVWLPAFTALAVAAALAVGVWLAALNVRYRDIKYAVPFLVQLWLFASPVAYPRRSSRSSGGRCSALTRWPASSRASGGHSSAVRNRARSCSHPRRRRSCCSWEASPTSSASSGRSRT